MTELGPAGVYGLLRSLPHLSGSQPGPRPHLPPPLPHQHPRSPLCHEDGLAALHRSALSPGRERDQSEAAPQQVGFSCRRYHFLQVDSSLRLIQSWTNMNCVFLSSIHHSNSHRAAFQRNLNTVLDTPINTYSHCNQRRSRDCILLQQASSSLTLSQSYLANPARRTILVI